MARQTSPLIVVVNDDGITSPGLHAAVMAVQPLGEVLVVAPCRQWSGAGRSIPDGSAGRIFSHALEIGGQMLTGYCMDGTPALVVAHAVLELADRHPALLISGINYGENVGADITISGTVGAALQAASHGIPALAVSLETPKEYHQSLSSDVDFTPAAHFTTLFARKLLSRKLPFDVDVLKVDVPDDATPVTPWRLTRVSRHTYYVGIPPERTDLSNVAPLDYEVRRNLAIVEPDSDIYAFAVERVVSVTPLSLDLSSRVDLYQLDEQLRDWGEEV